jgi:hypothetical protein
MTVSTSLEITGAIIRVFQGDAAFGDPFDFALFVTGDEGTATIKGLRMDGQRLMPAHRDAVFAALREHGFHTAVWHRHKAGGSREVRIGIADPVSDRDPVPLSMFGS